MANATPSRFGQVNQAGDTLALWLVQFAGEVFTAFMEKNVTLDKHYVRTITSGKAASFPMVGKTDADYHTPGTEITGTGINSAEQVIDVDDILVASTFIAEIDEAMAHFDVRRPYADAQGAALARKLDKNVLQLGVLAARSTSPLTANAALNDGNGGSVIVSATALTDGLALAQGIVDASRTMDEKDIPEEDRFCYVKPAQYQLLLKDAKDYIDFDFTAADRNGSLATGKIGRINNVQIVKTNNLPRTNITTGKTKYQGNFANTAALVMNRQAVGTVKLMDVTVDTQWDLRRLGTLLVARNLLGSGILRPDCAVEIATA